MSSANISSLETRLNALHESHKRTLQLVSRLANFKFQPGSPSLASEDTNVRTELTAEIHESLKKEDEELEILKQEVQDFTESTSRRDARREQEQTRLNVQVARIGEDCKLARARFRAAQVTSKRDAALARAQERDLLFASKDSDEAVFRRRTERSKGGQDEAVAASGDVTAALQRTLQLMQTEVQRSHFAQEVFNQSSEAIKNLSQTYNDLDSLLASSGTLLKTLVTSNKSDTWYLESCVYILLATIGWLFFRRFIYGPSWWLIYLPLRLAFRAIYTIFGVFGLAARSTALSQSLPSVPQPSISATTASIMASQQPSERNELPKGGEARPLSDEIVQMVEKDNDKDKERIVRGDGTVLQHLNVPRNPKKKMFAIKDEDERVKGKQAEPVQVESKSKDEL